MKNIWVAVIFSLALTSAHADLPSFADDVARAEAASDKETERDESYDDGGGSIFGEILFQIFRLIWFYNNSATTYGEYPYAERNFVHMPIAGLAMMTGETTGYPAREKNHWYSAELQGFRLEGIGDGTWFTLRGNAWRFFGPYIDGILILDDKSWFQAARIGASFTLFQSDPLSMNLYGQWNSWNGILDKNGASLGFDIQSFPVKPLALHARMGFQTFNRFAVAEAEVRAGILVERWEVFAGWRWWDLQTVKGSHIKDYSGPFAGTAVWF